MPWISFLKFRGRVFCHPTIDPLGINWSASQSRQSSDNYTRALQDSGSGSAWRGDLVYFAADSTYIATLTFADQDGFSVLLNLISWLNIRNGPYWSEDTSGLAHVSRVAVYKLLFLFHTALVEYFKSMAEQTKWGWHRISFAWCLITMKLTLLAAVVQFLASNPKGRPISYY